MEGYIGKQLLINVKNKDIVALLNRAENEEIIDTRKIMIFESINLVLFDMFIEEKYYDVFIETLKRETNVYELIKD